MFGVIFPNNSIPRYPLYLLAGLACWIFFSVSLQSASRSMVDSAELIRKVRFPRQLVAFSMVATQAVTFVVMLVILIVLSLIFVDGRAVVWLALPLAVLFAGLVAGLSLLVACLNVLFRDIEHVLTAALLPWFFLTPILWSPAYLEAAKRHHVLIEALASGTPIVATRDAGTVGVVDDGVNGVLVEADHGGFARAFGTLIDDRARLARLREGAAESGQRWSIEACTDRLEEIFVAVSRRRPRAV